MTGASRFRRIALRASAGLLVLAITAAALLGWRGLRGDEPVATGFAATDAAPSREVVERGAYLARAGNCMGCHTPIGGAPYAGGRSIATPFGSVVASNITPDVQTGIGAWSAGDFWQALHHGRSRDGRLLYPAFPYPSFTFVTREDSDALYAFLKSVPAVAQANQPHALRFPYDTQAALAVWRALYFRVGQVTQDGRHGDEWNRGRYLVQGLGHCAACHSSRDVLGGTSLKAEFAGGLMPGASWYAPSLAMPDEAGVQRWSRADVVKLLKQGVTAHASVAGPMAEVVFGSTQHLADSDVKAMAVFLAAIPPGSAPRAEVQRADDGALAHGGKLYDQHCAACHGDKGQSVSDIYPALAGNRAVLMTSSHNLIQVIRHGGFAPTTAGNRQPFGMPPFGQALNDAEIAAVATFVRQSWGNMADPVSAVDVLHVR